MFRLTPFQPLPLLGVFLAGAVALTDVAVIGVNPRTQAQTRARVSAQLAQLPLSFEPNQAQSEGPVRFLSRASGGTLLLSGAESVLRLRKSEVKVKLRNSNPSARVSGADPLPGKVNYFLGNDPKRWRRNVPLYAKVRSSDVYPGIDAIYYGGGGELEYDFVVHPGADPDRIRLQVSGAERVEINPAGDLVLHTADGPVRQHRPHVYQERGGTRQPVGGEYVLAQAAVAGDGSAAEVSFKVGDYDRGQPLIIDPVITYSTYLGGDGATALDDGNIAVDDSGNAYLTGTTSALDFPTSPGAFDLTFSGGSEDVFITKLDTNSSGAASLVYSTYIGGNSVEYPVFKGHIGIALGADASVYVAGNTVSPDFPTTPGAYDRFLDLSQYVGNPDGFVARIDPTGSDLIYSTLFGGKWTDQVAGVAVDPFGNAYITGWAQDEIPHTPGAVDAADGNQSRAGFVAKLNPSGTSLVYSARIGGWKGDNWLNAIAIDAAGAAYITGVTGASNFPVTAGAYDTTFHPGGKAFVTKLSPSGSSLVFSTYLGPNSAGWPTGYAIAVGNNGWVYVVGETSQADFPVTPNAFQPNKIPSGTPSNFVAVYLSVLNSAGSDLVYSTYISSGEAVFKPNLTVDDEGLAHVTGLTNSDEFALKNPLKSAFAESPDYCDAFVAIVDPNRAGDSSLLFSTLLGGTAGDWGEGIAVDQAGSIFVIGVTYSDNFPVLNAFQLPLPRPGPHGFLTRLDLGPRPEPPSNLTAAAISSTDVRLTWSDTSELETGFQVERAAPSQPLNWVTTTEANVTTFQDEGLDPNTTYRYRVRAIGAGPSSAYTPIATVTTLTAPPAPASNLSVQLAAVATTLLQWQDNSDESGFRILRSTDNFATSTTIDVAAGQTTYTESGLARNTRYSYRVVAFSRNADGVVSDAPPSNVASVLTAPANPTDLAVAAVGDTQLRLTWTDGNPAGGTSTFEVCRSSDVSSYPEVATATVSGGASGQQQTYLENGLSANTQYFYRVRAVSTPGPNTVGGGGSGYAGPAMRVR